MSVRLPGEQLVLTRDELRLIAFGAPELIAKHRRAGIDSPMLRSVLAEVHAVAVGGSDHAGSASGSVPILARTGAGGQSDGSGWISTRAAADRLEISMRRVVALLQEGRITGQQQATNSAWRVSEESVELYRAHQSIYVREAS
jgi:hypothetical protein